MGNPLTYNNGNKNWEFTWQHGRQLAKAEVPNGSQEITYTYDVDGIRESKTVNGVKHSYTTLGGKIVREAYGSYTIDYFYDNDSRPYKMVVKNGTSSAITGYFVLNLQGDVIAIIDSVGAVAVKYQYDAWGREISNTVNENANDGEQLYNCNALKYRGYYYDVETGFYYVSSRYYDPEIGRFISADEYITTGQGALSYNMYAYCFNNPVNRVDPTGNNSSLAQMWTSTMWWLCTVDSVLPIGDLIYLGGALLLGVAAINSYSSTTITGTSTTTYKPTTDSKAKEEEKVNAVTKTDSLSIPIYRYGGTNPGNLIPSKNDVATGTGMSFSTIPKPGSAMTTIEAVNATGVLIAIQDGPTHVSVYPVGTTIEGWRNAGTASIWTKTLKSIVIKWTP